MNGTLSGLLAILMWSVTALIFVEIRNVPVFELVALNFFTGYLCLTAMQFYLKEDIRSYWRRPLSDYLFWICGPGIYTILIFYSFRMAPVFEANILNALWPILLIIFSASINDERLTPAKILGMLIGFTGAVIVLAPSGNAQWFEDFHLGHLLALVCAVIWALYSTLTKKKSFPPGFLACVFLVFAGLCLGLHVLFETTVIPDLHDFIFVALLGVFRVSYALWDYGMKKGNVILLASVSYFLPLISSVLLIAFGLGPARPLIGLGAALIIAGCITVNFDRMKQLVLKKS